MRLFSKLKYYYNGFRAQISSSSAITRIFLISATSNHTESQMHSSKCRNFNHPLELNLDFLGIEFFESVNFDYLINYKYTF